MRKSTRMVAMAAAKDNRDHERRHYDRTEMVMPYMGGDYDVYDRFRDRRGREHYDNGRFAPQSAKRGTLTWDNTHENERYDHPRHDRGKINYPHRIGYEHTEPYSDMDALEDRHRYRRDSRGRFRSEIDDDDMEHAVGMHYPGSYPYPPPVYEMPDHRGDRKASRVKIPIGFAVNATREIGGDYKSDAEYHPMNEMERRGDLRMLVGGASAGMRPFDKEMAEEWMACLENEDGTAGPHWSLEQIKQVIKQRNIDVDPIEFWVAMNAIYSDYCKVALANKTNTMDFYIGMAKAFIDDPDAQKEKLGRYYQYIVKH